MGTTRKFDPSEPVLAHLANLKAGFQAIREARVDDNDAEIHHAILALYDRVGEIERKILELPAFALHPLARARLFGDMFDPPFHPDDVRLPEDSVIDAPESASWPDDVVSEHGLRTDRPERERVCVLELAVGPVVKPKRGAWWQAQYIPGESVRVLAGPHRGRTGVITTVGLMSYEVDLDPVGS